MNTLSVFKVKTNFTRPANTTAYAVGDAVTNSTSAPTVFELLAGKSNGDRLVITKAQVISNIKGATLPLFKMWLFSTTFTSTNDNAALSIVDAQMQLGPIVIDLDEQHYTAINSLVEKTLIQLPVSLEKADMKLYGILEAQNVYTPGSEEVLTVILEGYIV